MDRKFDFNKCSKEQLVRFQELYYTPNASGQLSSVMKDIERTAQVRLRTRAEVDADIAKVIRDYASQYHVNGKRSLEGFGFDYSMNQIQSLVNEETQG